VRVVVTGGSGFIGSHVVDRLAMAGHEPVVLDLAPPRRICAHVAADLLDADATRAAVRGADAIIHLAAVADVNDVVADPARAEAVNARGTLILLEAARQEGVARVLYGSTVWVYGDCLSPEPVVEDVPVLLPAHLYTATKLAGEMYCRSYGELYGLGQTILRFGIPYGPRSREAAVVAAFVKRARAGEPLSIAGDGAQTRQFVYVEDLADGIVAALAPEAEGRVYNLVRDEEISIRTIADTVRKLVAAVPIVHTPERPADVRIPFVSGARAAAELGWVPETGFTEGVERYLESLAVRSSSPVASALSRIAGSAAAVFIQEPSAE
jgi:UDP-glucose 4-epimerase